jgi:hypothetical protein
MRREWIQVLLSGPQGLVESEPLLMAMIERVHGATPSKFKVLIPPGG